MSATRFRHSALAAGVFLAAMALLALEILLIRAAQVAFGVDYKFLLIPLTLLGIGFGSAAVFVGADRVRASRHSLPILAAAFALASPLPFLVARGARESEWSLLFEIGFIVLGILVFSLAGALLAAAFRAFHARVTMLYGIDLCGAGIGVVGAASLMDAVGYEQTVVIALCAAVASALFFGLYAAWRPQALATFGAVSIALLLAVGAHSSASSLSILCGQPSLATFSNSFSQIDVASVNADSLDSIFHEFGSGEPRLSRGATVYRIGVDCFWIMSLLVNAATPGDASILHSALRSIPLAAESQQGGANVLVPGSGAGIDVIRARMYGARATAIEINPMMIEVARLFAWGPGFPYGQDNVTLVEDDARRFVDASDERFDVILSAKSGRYGGAGADVDFVSYDETVEAFEAYVRMLSRGGVFVFTTLPELMTNRNIVTAVRALEALSLDPANRLMLVRGREWKEDMLIVGREAFTDDDRIIYEREAQARGFETEVLDGAAIAGYLRRDWAMTDERPVPTRMRFDAYGRAFTYLEVLLLLAVMLALIAVPLIRGLVRRAQGIGNHRLPVAAIVALVLATSAGFVVFELFSIQKFFYLIGSPTYVLATVLATVLFGGSIGSLLSGYVRDEPHMIRALACGMIAMLALYGLFLDSLFAHLIPLPLNARIAWSVMLLAVPSILLGAFFPSCMRLASRRSSDLIPWVWALSGLAAVFGGFAAKFLFASYGFSETLACLVLMYGFVFLVSMHRSLLDADS